jgi:signal transduction histidine kinase/HAMP domain-containing protein
MSIAEWLTKSLNRRFTVFLITVAGSVSLAFLVIFLYLYHQQLAQERSQASQVISLLLQASLENAMLKRDLDGLRNIVDQLGKQPGISRVMILNPEGEIRFASAHELLQQDASALLLQFCPSCTQPQPPVDTVTQLVVDDRSDEVLRTFHPVKNRPPCQQCHGSVAENPVNGVLVVDYDAASLRDKARSLVIMLGLAGATVFMLAGIASWWFMQRFVLGPVTALDRVSRSLSAGDLSVRAETQSHDEIGRFSRTFNAMVEQLQESHDSLRQREQFLQGLIDANADGVRVIDGDYRIVMANGTYCKQIGQELEQVLGSRCYASSHRRDTPCPPTLMTCPLLEIQQSDAPLKCVQQFQEPTGSSLQVEIFAAPLHIEKEGRMQTLIVESIRDLSKQIQYSHEQKLAGLGELAAGVAHEIHNPLASIRMALQGMAKTADEEQKISLSEELKEYLQLVDDEIDHCIDVTNRLLKLSALPGKQTELVAVNAAITETLSLLHYEAEQQDVEIDLSLDPGAPRILAADSDLRMIALNLAQNAFHAMPRGGRLRVISRIVDGRVELIFEDTGSGIAEDILPRIFDPFFSRRADYRKGSGLGLTISKALVERHGGDIEVTSSCEQGTRFSVRFPNADEMLR